ncbi:MAG: VWA domain-containing protein, partial [Lachnospiraceae bacterium]|nr:VWA domain-containing protein [Lachnospiraceae bacterium]
MNNKKKMLSKRIVAGIMSALVLVSNTGISAFAAEQSRAVPNGSGYVSIADPSTMDVWKNYFSTGNDATNQKLLSTEFAGGVWTDKSVFTAADAANSTELPSGAKSIGADNFLVALSAIASNKEIVGYSTIPTDTILVLDVSQSMDSANSIPNMVSAANSAISRLLELNKNNRVGVVLYSGNHEFGNSETSSGTELLSLGRYTANANKQYLTYSSYRYNNNDPNGTRITTATGLKTESGQNVTQTAKTTQGGTYIQNGLYKAWQMFEKVTDTVVTTSSGNNVQEGTQRMPIMVLMSDGAPTAGTTSYQSVGTSNQGNGGDSSSGLGFLTQLTAAWVRQKIENKYNNTAMKFYTLGLDLSRDSDTTKHDVAASVLDPKNSMSAIDADWTDLLGDGSASITVPNLYNYGGNTRNVTVSLANDGITFDASSQNYVDRYFEADSNEELNAAFGDIVKEIIVQSAYYPTLVTEGNHNLDGYVTFEDVLGQFMEVKEIKGLMLGDTLFTGEVLAKMMVSGEFGNATKYTDTGWELVETVSERIGVEEAQAITLLQEAWKSKQLYWESDTAYSNYIGWYEKADGSFVAHWADTHTAAEEEAEVAKGAKYITKSYGFYGATGASSSIQGTNMMHVVIKVRTDIATGHQDVIYQIPAALIPTITYSISLNADSVEEATEISLTVNEE